MSGQAQHDQLVAQLLEAAIDAEPGDLSQFLSDNCNDPAVIAQVSQLLESENTSDSPLDTPLISLSQEEVERLTAISQKESRALEERPVEKQIGPFTVGKLLGKGGMGQVYEAEQSEPVQRKVALKLTKHTLDKRKFEALFSGETQAMARLNHPNIAQMYEAGTTAQGNPWFAMELVDGQAINVFCDSNRLSIEKRIRIMIKVCKAVQHAHQKQLLHRDIKPSNILVTETDGFPTPKIIDFGVALSLDPGDRERNGKFGSSRVGTPGYASPESLAPAEAGAHLDTRSDIYSLGVVLYELLCGQRPFDGPGVSINEVLRRIREGEPEHPWVLVAEMDYATGKALANARSTSQRKLRHQLESDLDSIVMKGITRTRDERYGSAAELAADLQAWLEHQPVSAHPQDLPYIADKFIRRHRGLMVTGCLLLLAMFIGLVAWSNEARRANQEAERANLQAQQAREALSKSEEVSKFLIELFQVASIESSSGEDPTIRELLDRGADNLEAIDEFDALNKASLMQAMSEVYTQIKVMDRAQRLVTEALVIRQREREPGHWEIAESMAHLGSILRSQLEFEAAEDLLTQALNIAQDNSLRLPELTARIWRELGNLYDDQARQSEAIAAHEQALAILDIEMNGADTVAISETLNDLGVILLAEREYSRAYENLRRTYHLRIELFGDDDIRTAGSAYRLGIVEESLGRLSEAELHFRHAILALTHSYGELHFRPIISMENLALRLGIWGLPLKGVSEATLALTARQRRHGANHPSTGTALLTLAGNQVLLGRFEEARRSIDQAHEIYVHHYGHDNADTWSAVSSRAWLYWNRGDFEAARALNEQVLAFRINEFGPRNILTAYSQYNLGLALASLDQPKAAEKYLRSSLETRARVLGSGNFDTANSQHVLGLVLWQRGDHTGGKSLLQQAFNTRSRIFPDQHPQVIESRNALQAFQSGAAPLAIRPNY